MAFDLHSLLETVRKACLSGLWSQGVKLAREGSPLVESTGETEVVLRVRAPGQAVAPTVVLYPNDREWACDCDSKVDPCAHVAAAVIALTQAGARGQDPTAAPKARAHISYRFVKKERSLSLERYLVSGDREELMSEPLATIVARGDTALAPTHDELKLDRILSGFRRGFDWTRLADVLDTLASVQDVRFDGRKVKASGEPLLPRAEIVDGDAGSVVLRVEKDPSVKEVLLPDLVLSGDTLRPLAETELTGERLERLPLSRTFAPAQFGELVTEILPELEKKFPVEVRSQRLPVAGRAERPSARMEYSQGEHTLSVLPTLVYGDPPRARIDDGKLIHLSGEVPIRDEAAERALIHRLRDELNLVFGRRVDFDGREAVRFLARLEAWNGSLGESEPKLFRKQPLLPRFEMRGDAFDLTFEEPSGERDDGETPGRADATAVLRAFQDGLSMVALEGGGFAPLPHDWLEKYGHRVADLLAARDADGKIATVALPALGELCDELGAPRPPGLAKLAPLLDDFTNIPDAPLPRALNAVLRHYQKQGVDWLCFLQKADLGAVLADDMGLGKTLQVLCAMKPPALVVCPKSVVYNWAQEIARFRPDLRTAIYQGKNRTLDDPADITLVTYAVLRLDVEQLAAKQWATVVLDEAQAIKNSDSQVARASYELSGDFRVALSGTPVENRLEELWSLFRFTNPGLLGTRSDFQERYSTPIAGGNAVAAARLRARTKPFLLRRLKRDVAPELPARTDVVLYCELDEEERSVYDAVRVATRKEVLAKLETGGGVLAALEALLRLRQAACHSALVPGQSAAGSSKLVRLLEALDEAAADGHKALVFSQWTSLLDLIEPHLHEANIAFTRLDGSTRDRGAVVDQFQSEEGPPVMLASIKAGGTGLNLTAADHVFLVDPWWNPAVEDQAADRAHRIGQDRPVMVYRLVTKDTVEEGILALQSKKRALSDVALGNADHAGGLTRADLMALLG
jgi:superfamily II DNA or RNA helicase